MSRIIYKKGSLFETTSRVLVQANNAIGKCGKGIALEFYKRYPTACNMYMAKCEYNLSSNKRSSLVGTAVVAEDPTTETKLGFLITSQGYGKYVDSPAMIINSTDTAISDLLTQLNASSGVAMEISSNKFNFGLFRVPWEETEKLIEKYLSEYPNVTWTVWIL